MTTYTQRTTQRFPSKNRESTSPLPSTRPQQADADVADSKAGDASKKRSLRLLKLRGGRRFSVARLSFVLAKTLKAANFGTIVTIDKERPSVGKKSLEYVKFESIIAKHERYLVCKAPAQDEIEAEMLKAIKSDEVQAQVRDLVSKEVSRQLANLPAGAVDGLAAAKVRGASYTRTEWEKPENVPLLEAAAYNGRSDRVINEARKRGELYALVLEGKSRGYRYPLWQFNADPTRLAKVLEPLNLANASCWVKHNFLIRPNTLLGGRSPREIILDPNADIEQLVQVANNRFAGDQGAS